MPLSDVPLRDSIPTSRTVDPMSWYGQHVEIRRLSEYVGYMFLNMHDRILDGPPGDLESRKKLIGMHGVAGWLVGPQWNQEMLRIRTEFSLFSVARLADSTFFKVFDKFIWLNYVFHAQ